MGAIPLFWVSGHPSKRTVEGVSTGIAWVPEWERGGEGFRSSKRTELVAEDFVEKRSSEISLTWSGKEDDG